MKAPIPVLTFDRRRSVPLLVGVLAGTTLFAAAFWQLLIDIDRAMVDVEWQFMPSVGMLGHIL